MPADSIPTWIPSAFKDTDASMRGCDIHGSVCQFMSLTLPVVTTARIEVWPLFCQDPSKASARCLFLSLIFAPCTAKLTGICCHQDYPAYKTWLWRNFTTRILAKPLTSLNDVLNCFRTHSTAFWAKVNNASNARIIPSVIVTFLDCYDFYQMAF